MMRALEQKTTLEHKLEKLRQICEKAPDNPIGLLALAETAFRRGLRLEALEAYQKVLKDESVAEAHLCMAQMYRHHGLYQEALAELRTLFEIEPGYPEAHVFARELATETTLPQDIEEVLVAGCGQDELALARVRLSIARSLVLREGQELVAIQDANSGDPTFGYYIGETRKRLTYCEEVLSRLSMLEEARKAYLAEQARQRQIERERHLGVEPQEVLGETVPAEAIEGPELVAAQDEDLPAGHGLEGEGETSLLSGDGYAEEVSDEVAPVASLEIETVENIQGVQWDGGDAETVASDSEDYGVGPVAVVQPQTHQDEMPALDLSLMAEPVELEDDQATQVSHDSFPQTLSLEFPEPQPAVSAEPLSPVPGEPLPAEPLSPELLSPEPLSPEPEAALEPEVEVPATAAPALWDDPPRAVAPVSSERPVYHQEVSLDLTPTLVGDLPEVEFEPSAESREPIAPPGALWDDPPQPVEVAPTVAPQQSAYYETGLGDDLVASSYTKEPLDAVVDVPEPAAAPSTQVDYATLYEPLLGNLDNLIQTLAKTRSVSSVFLLNREGYLVTEQRKDPLDRSRLTEFIVETVHFLEAFADSPQYWVLECAGGIVVIQSVDGYHFLVTVGQTGANFGALRYTMDRVRPNFEQVLQPARPA